jgi:hypothetical protein
MLLLMLTILVHQADSAPKKKAVSIIDMKRAQNGGISLARIKIPFSEIRER